MAKSLPVFEGKHIKTKEGSRTPLLRPCHCAEEQTLADRGAACACPRAGSIHADHAGLIGVVHVLSSGRRSDWLSCYRIRLIARTGGGRNHVAALGPG